MASVIWTSLSSTAACLAGLASGSLLLVVFGLVGVLDLVGSVVLVVHFRHALRHQAISGHGERRALLAIALGMGAIALGTSVESARRLVEHHTTASDWLGSAVAGSSMAILAVLAVGKGRVGRRLDSRALVADSHVSTMGAFLAAFTLGGTIAAGELGWWWLDPTGSLAVALVGTTVAVSHLHAGG